MELLVLEILKTTASGAVLAAIIWISKLPKSIRENTQKTKENTEALGRLDDKISDVNLLMKNQIDSIDESRKRLDVTDVVVSSILKDSFSSAGIVKNKTDWPRIFDPEYRSAMKNKKKEDH